MRSLALPLVAMAASVEVEMDVPHDMVFVLAS
jgi:hypothetical protein